MEEDVGSVYHVRAFETFRTAAFSVVVQSIGFLVSFTVHECRANETCHIITRVHELAGSVIRNFDPGGWSEREPRKILLDRFDNEPNHSELVSDTKVSFRSLVFLG